MDKLIEAAAFARVALVEAEYMAETTTHKGMVLAAILIDVGRKRAAYEEAIQALGEAVLFASEACDCREQGLQYICCQDLPVADETPSCPHDHVVEVGRYGRSDYGLECVECGEPVDYLCP